MSDQFVDVSFDAFGTGSLIGCRRLQIGDQPSCVAGTGAVDVEESGDRAAIDQQLSVVEVAVHRDRPAAHARRERGRSRQLVA